MSRPLVSILVCCHNRVNLLRETLASVLAQRYDPVEILVLDDGSTDETPELMRSYSDRVRYVRQTNQGIAIARTNAARLARGELIAYHDDDDLMPADRIVTLAAALAQFPSASFAVGDYEIIDETGASTGHRWLPATEADENAPQLIADGYEAVLWPRVPAAPHTTLFRRADGERIGWFDPAFRFAAEDKDFFARLARLGPIVYLPKVVSRYRRGHASLTRHSVRTEYGAAQLYRKHLLQLCENDTVLRRRLVLRLRMSLERIAEARLLGEAMPANVQADELASMLAVLPLRERARYAWRTRVRVPLRRLIRGR